MSEPENSPDNDANLDAALGRRIKSAREARDLTQQAISTQSKFADPEGKGISRTALVGYENGNSKPGARELRILCETLRVTPNHLLFGNEQPFETVAMEGMSASRGRSLQQAVQLAFVLAALKDHERDALMSIALSFAGRQLGDVRLSGLRGVALLMSPAIEKAMQEMAGPQGQTAQSLEAMVDVVSHQVTTNIGNRVRFDENGDPQDGPRTYPDPQS